MTNNSYNNYLSINSYCIAAYLSVSKACWPKLTNPEM